MRFLPIRLSRNRRILILVILVVAGGSFLAGILSFSRWESSQYFGQVESMTGSGFVISDVRLGQRVIDMDDATVVRRGPRTVTTGVEVGERVMVVGIEGGGGHVRAKVVRLVNGRNPARPQ